MFRADTETDEARAHPAWQGCGLHDSHGPGELPVTGRLLLEHRLHPLREPGWELAAALYPGEIVTCNGAFAKWPGLLPAATASWMARLIPTPPMGDMACAASPMQSKPGRCHCRRRSTFTVNSFTSFQSRTSPCDRARMGRFRRYSRATLRCLWPAFSPPLLCGV